MDSITTIPAGRPFLDSLVAGLFQRIGTDPLGLAEAQIILPTRRAVRSLREAFLRATDGALLLLPRMFALGDIDADELDLALPGAGNEGLDLPPAIAPIRRELLLARIIRRRAADVLPGQALALARELATLIDQVHTERSSFDRLEALVPAELAEHWRITVDFLSIVSHAWPEFLAIEGAIDPADRRNRLIASQIEAWRHRVPTAPLIAAGLESTIPAVGDLIEAIMRLPAGSVVLNGLDADADDLIWQAAKEDPTHPQYATARLLDRLAIERTAVPAWCDLALPRHAAARAGLVREIMRPAAVSEAWRDLAPLGLGATDGMARIDLTGSHEEAATVALLLRDRLDTPGATAMLVTPDRDLARRVAAEMRRWGVEIDDSAGRPLGRTPPGGFLRLVADAVAEGLAPLPLLALLKHPLAALGLEPGVCRERARAFELAVLRGPRPAPGLAGLRALAREQPDALDFIDRLERALAEFVHLRSADTAALPDLLQAHVVAAERLAATETVTGAERLWSGEAGEAAAGFIAEFGPAAADFDPIAGADYPMLFEAAMGGRVVRSVVGRHARLQILGTLEARLQSADLVVVGGLNEGTWPPESPSDPWMSRPMRARFGLAPAETATGIAAHDFTMALSAPEIVLTRAVRVEGTPTVPSRWLLRLDTVLTALRLDTLPLDGRGYHGFRAYQALLDRPDAVRAMAPPAPRPPVSVRPRKLAVTQIETWMRDPYAIYARHILRLEALEPLDADPSVADRGQFIHRAMERFLRERGGLPAPAWLDLLTRLGRESFGDALVHPGVRTFWWPRFLKIAGWVVETELARIATIRASLPEMRGRLEFAGPAGGFTLTAKADRIDTLATGSLAIIDYKTGASPNKGEITAGYAPQLPLEALIAEAGGFKDLAAAPVEELAFWQLLGTATAGEIKPLADLQTLIAGARSGLQRLIDSFDKATTPYHSQPHPALAPRYTDYAHLARVKEWSVGADE